MKKKADNLFNEINYWLSREGSDLSLSGKIYPNSDGKADYEAAAELAELRQSLYSLEMACKMAVSHLTIAIEAYEENEKSNQTA